MLSVAPQGAEVSAELCILFWVLSKVKERTGFNSGFRSSLGLSTGDPEMYITNQVVTSTSERPCWESNMT